MVLYTPKSQMCFISQWFMFKSPANSQSPQPQENPMDYSIENGSKDTEKCSLPKQSFRIRWVSTAWNTWCYSDSIIYSPKWLQPWTVFICELCRAIFCLHFMVSRLPWPCDRNVTFPGLLHMFVFWSYPQRSLGRKVGSASNCVLLSAFCALIWYN